MEDYQEDVGARNNNRDMHSLPSGRDFMITDSTTQPRTAEIFSSLTAFIYLCLQWHHNTNFLQRNSHSDHHISSSRSYSISISNLLIKNKRGFKLCLPSTSAQSNQTALLQRTSHNYIWQQLCLNLPEQKKGQTVT